MLLDGPDTTDPYTTAVRLERTLFDLWRERAIAVVLQPDGRIAFATAAAAALLGRNVAEVVGSPLASFVPPAEHAGLAAALSLAGVNEPEVRTTFSIRWPDGAVRWLDAGLRMCALEEWGKRIVVTATDVTALHRTIAALGDSEARFRQIADTIDEVFWLTDAAKERMIYVSPAYERIWGRTCASLYASPRSWLEAIHEADRARVVDAALRFQWSGSYDVEYRVIRPDGRVRWVRDRAYPLVEDDGRVLRIAGVASDVTEQRTLQQRIEDGQVLEVVGRLAASVAHDLRNILGVLTLHCGLLALEPGLSHEGRASIDDLVDVAARAEALTRQLGTFSSRHATPRSIQPDTTDASDAASRLVRLCARVLGQGIDVRCHVAPVPRIAVPSAALDQVLVNLLVNAGDAMPTGGVVDVRVGVAERASLRPPDGVAPATRWVVLAVSDQGHGIAPEVLPRIFLPYFTTKDPDKGTGLGLATVSELARRHGGWVEVDTEVAIGTTFRVYWPALDPATA